MLERAWTLKQNLIDFVLDAEGELAVALEAFAATRSTGERYDIAQQNQVIDSFTVEGKVGEKTPIDLFVESQPDLTEGEISLLKSWGEKTSTRLFEITQISPDSFEVTNWLTAKHYTVKPNSPNFLQEMSRFKLGEILRVRIAPLTDDWSESMSLRFRWGNWASRSWQSRSAISSKITKITCTATPGTVRASLGSR